MNKIKYIMTFAIIFFTILYAQSLNEDAMDCDAGDAEACYKVGKLYSSQAHKEKSYDKKKVAHDVATLYKKSCDLGYAKGCTAYAMSYAADQQKDPSKDDAYYFQKACDAGDQTGCTMLKMMAYRQ
jgi:TPR repeat protein